MDKKCPLSYNLKKMDKKCPQNNSLQKPEDYIGDFSGSKPQIGEFSF